MKNELPWYLQLWFIIILFLLWPLYLPPLFGLILTIFHYKKIKGLKKRSASYQALVDSGYDESIDLADLIISQKKVLDFIENDIEQAKKRKTKAEEDLVKSQDKINKETVKLKEIANRKKNELAKEIESLKKERIELEDDVLMQSFGFFDPKYNLEDSEAYKMRLSEIRNRQKEMVKFKNAVTFNPNWTVDGSRAKGRTMNNNLIKQALRSFNNECDMAISKVTVNNISSMEKRIRNIFEAVNKMNKMNVITIKEDYLRLKLEELYLALEYAHKVETEKEEQRQIKEQMREEEKVRREIEKLKQKVEKEEEHFAQAIENLEKQKLDASDELCDDLENKIKELEEKLNDVLKQKEDVLNREQNTRAGYVYIISNIGSFGENVYKIGMTRRLEPMDRVRELGSASVPFRFDVHAMIFSEDAPTLENTLHQTFTSKRVNLVNERKEFFNVTLDELRKVVEHSHDKTVEFKMTALAEEYRETLTIKKHNKEQNKKVS